MPVSVSDLYRTLLDAFGHQDWWPMDHAYHQTNGTDPREEIVIGAVLTQNTAWTNVEKALANLKAAHALSFSSLISLDEDRLRRLIQPTGFYNQKAQRLRLVARALNGQLNAFFRQDLPQARERLLALNGIGPETADSILLYAGNLPSFVVDAYTKRLCLRLPLPVSSESYEIIQQYFEGELTQTFPGQEVTVYKELHALIVECAKTYCRVSPVCDGCPLRERCQQAFKLGTQRLRRDIRQGDQLR